MVSRGLMRGSAFETGRQSLGNEDSGDEEKLTSSSGGDGFEELFLSHTVSGKVLWHWVRCSGPFRFCALTGMCILVLGTVLFAVPYMIDKAMVERRQASTERDTPMRRLVEELYTFGAPGISLDGSLGDGHLDGGCIPGLRVYTRTIRSGTSGRYFVSDPIAWITAQFGYKHPKMATFAAGDYTVKNQTVDACSAEVEVPPHDDYWWISGHLAYEEILRAHVEYMDRLEIDDITQSAEEAAAHRADPNKGENAGGGMDGVPVELSAGAAMVGRTGKERVRRAYLMSHFAFMIYNPAPQKLGIDAPDWGWRLVGFTNRYVPPEPGMAAMFKNGYHDSAALYQHPETLECILVFEGTNRDDQTDWVADVDAFKERFCNLANVHSGFKHKLMRTMRHADYQEAIKSKLPHCSKVSVTGHSMGGAQAALFTACANRKTQDHGAAYGRSDEDHGLIVWAPGEPARMPNFYPTAYDKEESKLIRNLGANLCLDVRGTMETADKAEVVLYPCEHGESNYSKDQRWTMNDDGEFVNQLSGLCMDVGGLGGKSPYLIQARCGGSANQLWEITEEGFLLNGNLKTCVNSDMTVGTCAYTAQQWKIMPNGTFLHMRSGLCLDVEGDPGMKPGSRLDLWPCEQQNGTDQMWKLTADGTLQDSVSGLCVRPLLSEDGHNVVLSKCDDEFVLRLERLKKNFLRSVDTGMCLGLMDSTDLDGGSKVCLQPCRDERVMTSGLWRHMEGGFLRNVGNNWRDAQGCVEVAGVGSTMAAMAASKFEEGARLHLDVCEVGTDQQWLTAHSRLRNVIGGHKCLQMKPVPPGAQRQHTGIFIRNCAEWLGTDWKISETGQLMNTVGDRCIGIETSDVGSVPIVNSCRDPDTSVVTWDMMKGGVIEEHFSRECLAYEGDPANNDVVPLTIQPCVHDDSGPASQRQRWILKDGLLQSSIGPHTCVMVDASGMNLILSTSCPGIFQQFEFTEFSHIWNPSTGMCLDAVAVERPVECSAWKEMTEGCDQPSAPAGWSLEMADCDPLRAHQHWEMVTN